MSTVRSFWLVAVSIVCVCGVSLAQTYDFTDGYDPASPQRRGQAGMTFLQVGGSARAEGMGSAFGGVRGDLSMAFCNPAGVAHVEGYGVYAGMNDWIADQKMYHLSVGGKVGPVVTGVSFLSMDYGEIIGTVIDETRDGDYRIWTDSLAADAYAVGVFIAVPLTDRFAFGLQVKYAVQDFGDNKIFSFLQVLPNGGYIEKWRSNRISTMVFDLGTQYNTGLRNIHVNMSLQNFAATQKYVEANFDLPLIYRVGFSAEMLELVMGYQNPDHKINVSADGIDRRDVPLDYAVGVEYLTHVPPGFDVAVRFGRRPAENQEGWLSAGGGVTIPISNTRVSIDYSYNDYGNGMDSHRFGIGFGLK